MRDEITRRGLLFATGAAAVGIGVGSTTLGFGWSTGYVYFTPARARRVVFGGNSSSCVPTLSCSYPFCKSSSKNLQDTTSTTR